jgi:calcineurin-like phosphoesterase family protein
MKTHRIWVTADTHFGHTKLIELADRPEDFEQKIVDRWKDSVKEDELVIHLGDLSWGPDVDTAEIIKDLPGKKVMVLGNHDRKSSVWYMNNGWDFCCETFSLNRYGKRILFSHVPLPPCYRSDSVDDSRLIYDMNIHGHLHMNAHHPNADFWDFYDPAYHKCMALEYFDYYPVMLPKLVDGSAYRKKYKSSGYKLHGNPE